MMKTFYTKNYANEAAQTLRGKFIHEIVEEMVFRALPKDEAEEEFRDPFQALEWIRQYLEICNIHGLDPLNRHPEINLYETYDGWEVMTDSDNEILMDLYEYEAQYDYKLVRDYLNMEDE